MPEILIHDNNCKLRQHLEVTQNKHFQNTDLPVDVFHFHTKHCISDLSCQKYCNPAAFSDLIRDRKWRVNSSICEETNAWFGRFLPIVREMEATRYVFFLDEMIKRRNRYIVKNLATSIKTPWIVPIDSLFSSI